MMRCERHHSVRQKWVAFGEAFPCPEGVVEAVFAQGYHAELIVDFEICQQNRAPGFSKQSILTH